MFRSSIKLLLIILFQGTITGIFCQNGNVDTTCYDLINLKDRSDRIPILYKCDKTNLVNNYSLGNCISFKLEKPIVNAIIKGIEIERMSGGRFDPNIRFMSTYKIVLDENGIVENVQPLVHCLESINEIDVAEILYKTEWKPAIKNMSAVKSKFLVQVFFDQSISIDESWHDTQVKILNFVEYRRKEMIEAYKQKGGLWEVEVSTWLNGFKNLEEVRKIIDEIEEEVKYFIKSKDETFNRLSLEDRVKDKEIWLKYFSEWEIECKSIYEKELQNKIK